MTTEEDLDSPEPDLSLPAVRHLGEFARFGSLAPTEDSEPTSFTIQMTGDPRKRFVRLGHDGHPQANGRTLAEVIWSLALAHKRGDNRQAQDPPPPD